jgi:hypothetical protein
MHARLASLAILLLGALASGCTSFATVRPARVQPGGAFIVQGSITTPPGEEAGWFWSVDCAVACNGPVVAVDAAYTYGWTGARSYALGVGVNGGMVPYVEAYAQLGGDTARAYGLGARIGIPAFGWASHQLYARYDVPLAGGTRLLLNPGVFLHAGNSPNGENPGHFVALVPAIGVEHRGARRTTVPAVALVVGRGERESYGRPVRPFTAVFAAASVSVTFHRPRSAPAQR